MTTISPPSIHVTKARKRCRVLSESKANLHEKAGMSRSRNYSLSKSCEHLPSLSLHPRPNFVCHVKCEKRCPELNSPGKSTDFHSQDLTLPRFSPSTERLRSLSLNMKPQVKVHQEELETLEEAFRLPPLPHGSLTFQHVIRDLHFYDRCDYLSSSDDSSCSNDDNDGSRTRRRKQKKRCQLEWYGPIVEYKGHHIYLSTLTCLQVKVFPFVKPRWC